MVAQKAFRNTTGLQKKNNAVKTQWKGKKGEGKKKKEKSKICWGHRAGHRKRSIRLPVIFGKKGFRAVGVGGGERGFFFFCPFPWGLHRGGGSKASAKRAKGDKGLFPGAQHQRKPKVTKGNLREGESRSGGKKGGE